MKDLIAKIDFFSGLDDRILKRLGDASIIRQFTKNETIVRQGEMGLGVYVISRGHVKVDREQSGVRTQVADLGPEQCFGEMSLLDNKPRSATVTATVDTECLLLTRDSFMKLMNKYPEIPIRMARMLAERLRVANEKLTQAPAPAASPATPATPASAAQAAPEAPGTPSNGGTPAAAGSEPGMKTKVRDTLLDAFSSLYTMKAMTRFSVAVLGCPVEGIAENAVEQFQLGEVKILVFAADQPAALRIAAHEPGQFTAHWFSPDRPERHWGPLEIDPADEVWLREGVLEKKGAPEDRRS
jgi:CRP/FNR family transcriptional regulator, cyclic AMP receptor protein